MNYLGAIIQEQNKNNGIQPATFTNVADACAYFHDLLPPQVQKTNPQHVIHISNETYQYVLDNEERIKNCMCHLQQLHEASGYLNHMDLAELVSIIMQSIQVEEIMDPNLEAEILEDEVVDVKE